MKMSMRTLAPAVLLTLTAVPLAVQAGGPVVPPDPIAPNLTGTREGKA